MTNRQKPEAIDCQNCAGHGIVKAFNTLTWKTMAFECPQCDGLGWVKQAADAEQAAEEGK